MELVNSIGNGRSKLRKVGVVLAGYALALLAAYAAFYVWPRYQGPDSSGGMYAFGDFLLFAALLSAFALIPTLLALYFLRTSETFWNVLSTASLAFAATGPVMAALMGQSQENPRAVLIVGFFGLLRLFGTPLLGLCFLGAALIAPVKRARHVLLAAVLIEWAVAAYVFVSLIVLRHWL